MSVCGLGVGGGGVINYRRLNFIIVGVFPPAGLPEERGREGNVPSGRLFAVEKRRGPPLPPPGGSG